MARLDKRGRKVGYNWWREHNTNLFRDAHDAWSARRESGGLVFGVAGTAKGHVAYYQLSDEEYARLHPQPTYKELLIANAGMGEEGEYDW